MQLQYAFRVSSSQPPTPQPAWQPLPGPQFQHAPRDTRARSLSLIGIAIGLCALVMGTVLLVIRPYGGGEHSETNAPTVSPTPVQAFTAEQIAASKQKICDAREMVANAVSTATNQPDSNGDPSAAASNRALAQISLLGSASYLENQLDPATPEDLRVAVESLIEMYYKAVVGASAGGSETFDQDILDANIAAKEAERLCQ